ncbi:hypothetical protein FSP39_000926 [Pinctada imbricata]|uniref:Fibrinogen C-terminal domain-containing protein n=1 Tax=Pinctada imbricata TaxID=66713 RepID=A0AA88YTC5_PINIB|nr:hypothetical protein FSP39_000926 [Pinctada imbricata]
MGFLVRCFIIFRCILVVVSDTSSDDERYTGCGNMKLQTDLLKIKEELDNRFNVISELTAIYQLYRSLSKEVDDLKKENQILKQSVISIQNDAGSGKTKIERNTEKLNELKADVDRLETTQNENKNDLTNLFNQSISGLKEDSEKCKRDIAVLFNETKSEKKVTDGLRIVNSLHSSLMNAAMENITLLQAGLDDNVRLRTIQENLNSEFSANFTSLSNQFTSFKDAILQMTRSRETFINSTLGKLTADVEFLKNSVSKSVTNSDDFNPPALDKILRSCKEVAAIRNVTGIYTIEPIPGRRTVNATCIAGGWTVIQQRKDGSVDFYRTWQEYKVGFGTAASEYWIGNDIIHALTSSVKCELKIEMVDLKGKKLWAHYHNFYIENEVNKYVLRISGFSGNSGDALSGLHNGQKFTTKDQDNDNYSSRNCGILKHAGFWYGGCNYSNLNGNYHDKKCCKGFYWDPSKILQRSTMMVRCN